MKFRTIWAVAAMAVEWSRRSSALRELAGPGTPPRGVRREDTAGEEARKGHGPTSSYLNSRQYK